MLLLYQSCLIETEGRIRDVRIYIPSVFVPSVFVCTLWVYLAISAADLTTWLFISC